MMMGAPHWDRGTAGTWGQNCCGLSLGAVLRDSQLTFKWGCPGGLGLIADTSAGAMGEPTMGNQSRHSGEGGRGTLGNTRQHPHLGDCCQKRRPPMQAWQGQTDRWRTPGDSGVPEAKKGEAITGQGQLWARQQDR